VPAFNIMSDGSS